jgi:hypothetical protein
MRIPAVVSLSQIPPARLAESGIHIGIIASDKKSIPEMKGTRKTQNESDTR